MLCPQADLVLGRAVALDEDERVVTVRTDAGELAVGYENLVVALGAVVSWLPIPGLDQHAVGFENLGDAVHLRDRVLRPLDTASADLEDAERQGHREPVRNRQRQGHRRLELGLFGRSGAHALSRSQGDPA